ncbi:MAG: hypothetical protein CM1200mP20_03640 [Pseudomonadota bacterium]|nr:MAG: hypothetical protein CM1200mP20_03640 [Pseudomonadota bacterium]
MYKTNEVDSGVFLVLSACTFAVRKLRGISTERPRGSAVLIVLLILFGLFNKNPLLVGLFNLVPLGGSGDSTGLLRLLFSDSSFSARMDFIFP